MNEEAGLSPGYLVLACAIIICTGFALWLYQDTNAEIHNNYVKEFRRLHLYEKFEDIPNLRSKTLVKLRGDKLDSKWLPVVQAESDSFHKLDLLLRILTGDPESEVVYEAISTTINSLSEQDKKSKYLTKLNKISRVKKVYLEKYGLLIP